MLVGDGRDQEAERGGGSGRGRHHHLAHPELAGDARGVQRSRSAHRHHRVAARVAPLLHDVHAGRASHVLAHQVVDAPGRLRDREPEARGEPRHRGLRGGGVERHPPAEEVAGVEIAEQQVRVGHRRPGAALTVAGGSGLGAGAVGSDLQQAEVVHAGDRSAARADLHHVDHGRVHRKAAPLPEPADSRRLQHGCDVRLPVLDEGRLRGRPPHVESEEVGVTDRPPGQGARLRATRRPGLQKPDRQRFGGLWSGQPAGRLDEVEAPAEPLLAERAVELADVGGHEGLDVGVRGGGRGPFVLVDLRVHVARYRDRETGELGLDEIAHQLLVGGVPVSVQEADRERLHAVVHQVADLAADCVRVDRLQHGAVAAHALRDLAAVAPARERLREGQEQVVDVVALLRTHLQNVPEAPGGQQPEPGPAAFDDGVGGEGGPVHDVADLRRTDAGRPQQVGQTREGRDGRVLGRGQALVQVQPPVRLVDQDEVRERPADVEADPATGRGLVRSHSRYASFRSGVDRPAHRRAKFSVP